LVPGLLLPFLLTFTKIKLKKWQGLTLLIVPVSISIIWFILNSYFPKFSLKIEPFYPGMFTSILLSFSFILSQNKNTKKGNMS